MRVDLFSQVGRICKWRCESFGFVELQEGAVEGGEGAERSESADEAMPFILHVNTPCCQGRTPEDSVYLGGPSVFSHI